MEYERTATKATKRALKDNEGKAGKNYQDNVGQIKSDLSNHVISQAELQLHSGDHEKRGAYRAAADRLSGGHGRIAHRDRNNGPALEKSRKKLEKETGKEVQSRMTKAYNRMNPSKKNESANIQLAADFISENSEDRVARSTKSYKDKVLGPAMKHRMNRGYERNKEAIKNKESGTKFQPRKGLEKGGSDDQEYIDTMGHYKHRARKTGDEKHSAKHFAKARRVARDGEVSSNAQMAAAYI